MKTIYEPDFLLQGGGFLPHLALAAEGDTILAVDAPNALKERYPDAELQRWPGLAMLPGTVNTHNHAFQVMLRGLACDRPFLEWRDRALYRYSPKFTPEDVYASALLDFCEQARCGVTTVSEFFYLHSFGLECDEAVIRAAGDAGVRLVLARTMYDWDGAPAGYVESVRQAVENTRALAREHAGDPGVTVLPAPHSLHAASPEMVVAGHGLARELGTRFHIHVAEEPFEVEQVKKAHGGLTPLEFLDSLGVLDDRLAIIHGVWLKGAEIDLLGARGGCLAYCPGSNMYLADGVTDLPRMLRAGVTVGLGCDGACANSRNSIFEEMRMASLLQKASTCDALCVTYDQVMDMGTRGGADLLELPVGELAPGKKADLVGIAIDDLSLQPVSPSGAQLVPNLVYSMQPSAVRRVTVGGRPVVEDGALCTVPEARVLELSRACMRRIGL